MDKLGIKGTIYDLIGYVLPGLLLVIGMYHVYHYPYHLSISDAINVKMSFSFIFLSIAFMYICGHIISSLSSILFENRFSSALFGNLYRFDSTKFDEKSLELFGSTYSKCSERVPIAYCQEKHPIIYDLAFIFLSFYGMARNLAMSTAVIIICWHIRFPHFSRWSVIGIIIFALLFHQYLRFKLYFSKQIASSLLLK
jgi:hypothetical protein